MSQVLTKKHKKDDKKDKQNKDIKTKKNKSLQYKNENYKIYHYNNGTKIILIPEKKFKSMLITFTFKIGSKYEPIELSGISHFLEHMLFKGTKKYPNHKIINTLLDSNGIDFNAYTSNNVTGYYFKCLPNDEKLILILKIAYEMLFKSLIRQKDINIERNVIIQEYNDMIDNPNHYIDELIDNLAFKGHVLSQSVIGNVKSINNVDRKNLCYFYEKYYHPKNLFISVSGNIPNYFLKLLNEHFIHSKIKQQFIYNKPLFLFPYEKIGLKLEDRIFIKEKKMEQNQLCLLFNTDGLYDENINSYRLIANILGGNMSSRLFVKIREEMGLAYSINCNLTNYQESGCFIIYTKVEPNKTAECLSAIIREIKKLSKTIKTKELNSNKVNYIDIFKTEFDNLNNINDYYDNQFLFMPSIELPENRIKKINKVTLDNIKQLSNNLFKKENLKVLCYGQCKYNEIKNICEKF